MELNVYIQQFEEAYNVFQQVQLTEKYIKELNITNDIGATFSELQTSINTINDNIQTINSNILSLQTKDIQLENAIISLNNSITTLNNGVDELGNTVNTNTLHITQLTSRITALENIGFQKYNISVNTQFSLSQLPKGFYVIGTDETDEISDIKLSLSSSVNILLNPITIFSIIENVGIRQIIVSNNSNTVGVHEIDETSYFICVDYPCVLIRLATI